MCKLMDEKLRCELKKKLESKEFAAWGTCAGLILLAERLSVEDPRVIPVSRRCATALDIIAQYSSYHSRAERVWATSGELRRTDHDYRTLERKTDRGEHNIHSRPGNQVNQ